MVVEEGEGSVLARDVIWSFYQILPEKSSAKALMVQIQQRSPPDWVICPQKNLDRFPELIIFSAFEIYQKL
ncbi:MAG: hypothetical protein D6675_13360 [Gemmatimonadetes bacterium]|nr:MAG: hypothetical protein D6675_13360 [Gemmatimonadota bacterium]